MRRIISYIITASANGCTAIRIICASCSRASRTRHYHGKCERLHGHTYHLRVVLEGEPDAEGMIFDFVDLKRAVNELVLDRLDHAYINDIVEQPTAEYISRWIFRELDAPLRRGNCRLFEVQLWETEGSSVICRREDVKDA